MSGGVVLDVENDYAEIGESRRSFGFSQSVRCYYADESQALKIRAGQEVVITGEGDHDPKLLRGRSYSYAASHAYAVSNAEAGGDAYSNDYAYANSNAEAGDDTYSNDYACVNSNAEASGRSDGDAYADADCLLVPNANADSDAASGSPLRRLRVARHRVARARLVNRRLPVRRLEHRAGGAQRIRP